MTSDRDDPSAEEGRWTVHHVSCVFALAQLLAGIPIDVASVDVDDPHRELVETVAAATVDACAVFDAAADQRTDGTDLRRAVLRTDPADPPGETACPIEPPLPTDEEMATELEEARTCIVDIGARAKEDPGVVFKTETIGALAVVRDRDRSEWARARNALRKAGISLKDVEAALKDWRAEHSRLRVVTSDFTGGVGRTVGSMVEDAPMPDHVVPRPYFISETATGVVRQTFDQDTMTSVQTEVVIAHAPLVVSARLRDAEEGTEVLRLSWKRGDVWFHKATDRVTALDSRQLVSLANDGAPVTSVNAKDVVPYIDAFEAANRAHLPCARISSHLGWQGKDGADGFLVGRDLILPSGAEVPGLNFSELSPEDWEEDYVSFRGAAAGDDQIADAYCREGTMEGWREAVRVLAGYPRALLPFYTAFAPPLLSIVEAPNFVVDISNRTSTGKTTILRASASAWGKPDERSPESVIGSWDATRVWVERASAVLYGLPLYLDDTKRAKDPKVVAETLYAVANGRGRGRGNVQGLARTRAWRTVLVSTGEAPATSFTQDGGTRMRTLSVRGGPFGPPSEETSRAVNLLNVGLLANYGHAGPAFVRWLYACRSDWGQLRGMYWSAVESYTRSASGVEASRLAQYAALITLTASLVHQALDLPWAYNDPLTELWDELAAEASDAAGDIRALHDVISWAYSHEEAFHGRAARNADFSERVPVMGWAGRWDTGLEWEFIGFLRETLERVLRSLKYEPEAILAGWQERGWLVVDDDGRKRRTKRIRVGGERPHMIVISRRAIVESDS